MPSPFGWRICATGLSGDIQRIAAELDNQDLQTHADGEALILFSADVNKINGRPSAQWAGYELVRLVSAAADLRFGSISPLRFESVVGQMSPFSPANVELLRNDDIPARDLPLSRFVLAAQSRHQIRTALLACAQGGAEGLFQAYEALCSDLMDYAVGIGTKEWLIEQGWVEEQEEESFLDTVLHYSRHCRSTISKPRSPREAQEIIRRLLTKWIGHVSQSAL
jgi:hypothetical protein